MTNKKKFLNLLNKAISSSDKEAIEKQESRHSEHYTEKQTHPDNSEDTSQKQNDKSREHSS